MAEKNLTPEEHNGQLVIGLLSRIDHLPGRREHKCKPYVNARGELIYPSQQSGIGCSVCRPAERRVQRG